ncbi:MAG TPA: PASTA domain-containing protein [Bacteroidales bacterium]|jgi:beta-lactam-binding protein with PASTA domain|nr:PASTA domain-containing protein [Bacteroidales bacterium]
MNLQQRIKKIIRYIEERILLRNIVLALLILLFGTALIMQMLKIATRHNRNLSVPDFAGLSLQEAVASAENRNLRVEVFDSVFLADFERGTVVEQHPRAGFMVKKNRKIFLTMNAMNPERVAMPNLVDLTFIQARAKIESFGLKVGKISYEPDMGLNMVLAQRSNGKNLVPGDSVVKGVKIDLVLGKGLSDEQTGVPNLVGLSLESANILASDRFLSIGAAVRDQSISSDEDEIKAFVFRQRPEHGGTLPMGSAIDVWITLDSTKVPSFGQTRDSLAIDEQL